MQPQQALTTILLALHNLVSAIELGDYNQDGVKKLGYAFNVWGVDSGHDPPGKMKIDAFKDPYRRNFLDPKHPDSCAPYYDHTLPLYPKQGKQLNMQWSTMLELQAAAMNALRDTNYETHHPARNHAKAFFGIDPVWSSTKKKYTTPPISDPLYSHVVRWYKLVYGYMSRDKNMFEDDSAKPILMCGSRNIPLQKPTDYLRQPDGKYKINPITGRRITVQEQFSASFMATNRVFLIQAPFWHYFFEGKASYTYDEWPVDRDVGYSHYCMNRGSHGWSIKGGYGSTESKEITFVVPCPQAIRGNGKVPNLTRQPLLTNLDTMDFDAGTFYHEMFHLFTTDMPHLPGLNSVDGAVAIPKQAKDWPTLKSSWKLRPDVDAFTGIDALYQNLYDQSTPKNPVQERLALFSPNTYSWFALVSYMSQHTGQDWAAGVARDGGRAWQPVYAVGRNSPGNVMSREELVEASRKGLEAYTSRMRPPDGTMGLVGAGRMGIIRRNETSWSEAFV